MKTNVFLITSLVLLFSCNNINQSKSIDDSLNDISVSKIKLRDLNNHPIDLSQYKGKTIFINFWATWCKPCLQEMPSIQNAQEILKNKNVVFILASEETAEQIENFQADHDYNFNYVRVENLETLNIMALPTTYIFNPDGKLVFSEMGYRKWDEKSNMDLILNSIK
jgi:thiol-disulfide isomerase/thioredoxin